MALAMAGTAAAAASLAAAPKMVRAATPWGIFLQKLGESCSAEANAFDRNR